MSELWDSLSSPGFTRTLLIVFVSCSVLLIVMVGGIRLPRAFERAPRKLTSMQRKQRSQLRSLGVQLTNIR